LVVLAFEFESNDAPLFRLSLIENDGTCQGHAAFGLFQNLLFLSNNTKKKNKIKLICDLDMRMDAMMANNIHAHT